MFRTTYPRTRHFVTAIAVVALGVPATAGAFPSERAAAGDPQPQAQGGVDLRSPDATNAPEIGAQQEPAAPVDLRSPDAKDSGRMAQSPEPVRTVDAPSFDWADAGIGAGSVLGLLLIMLSVTFVVVHRRNRGMEGSGGPQLTT
jgi:hypothetical protein